MKLYMKSDKAYLGWIHSVTKLSTNYNAQHPTGFKIVRQHLIGFCTELAKLFKKLNSLFVKFCVGNFIRSALAFVYLLLLTGFVYCWVACHFP